MPHRFECEAHPAEDIAFICSDGNLEEGSRRILTKAGFKLNKDVLRGPGSCACFTEHELFPHLREVKFNELCFHLEHRPNAKRVGLFSHQFCGAYAHMGFRFDNRTFTQEERDFHLSELRVARSTLRDMLDSQGHQSIVIVAGVLWVDSNDKMNITWLED